MKYKGFSMLAIVSILAAVCLITTNSKAEEVAPWPTTTWESSTPEDQGIDANLFAKMYTNGQFTGSLLIVRHGFLVEERYEQGKRRDFAPHIFSCTKGIISALIGIAIHQKELTSVHQNVSVTAKK